MKDQINKAKKVIVKNKRIWKLRQRIWHTNEWKDRKRLVRRKLREFKNGLVTRNDYLEERKRYKEWCKIKKKEHEKEEEEKIKNIKTESEVWNCINKRRKEREGLEEEIPLEKWEKHFIESLDGTKIKVVNDLKSETINREGEKEKEEDKEEEDDIQDIVFAKQIAKLKRRKAVREDGIENEAWIHATHEIVEAFKKMVRLIWKEGGVIEDWKVVIISPVFKKGDKSDIRNYRGVTIMDTAYKIYAGILNDRLENVIENNLSETQFSFRKGRGTVDCIYFKLFDK